MEFGLCIPHYGKPLDIPNILDTVRLPRRCSGI